VFKAGVAGAGVFGGYHAGKYASLPGVRLAAVYDHDLAQAQAMAQRFGAEAFDDLDGFLAAVDLVTLATPADTHGPIGLKALAAGRHLYVEKPLAMAVAEGRALVEAARAAGRALACGHQERVVFSAMGLFDLPERPVRIEAVRRGLPSPRCREVSCVTDVMIHDLDLALVLAGGPAVGAQAGGSYDEVVAEVDFGGGLSGRFEASRIAERRERTMRVEFPSGAVEIDFLAPSFENRTSFALDAAFAETPAGRDPLGTSVAAFVAAAQGRGRPTVTGEEGAAALELALQVEAAASF
jgi:predicted dehydrogenase